MKEIPILFSTPMVEAKTASRKTQTRRIIKPQPDDSGLWNDDKHPRSLQSELSGWNGITEERGESRQFKCPYGQPGDILWVRETWQYWNGQYHYKADQEKLAEIWRCPLKWKPSIHMPKAAARIWLEVVDVRVERLQDISEEDAKAEGVQPNCPGDKDSCSSASCKNGCVSKGEYFHYMHDFDDFPAFSAKESFESLWEKINGRESWDANPWVWVISFRVLSTTGKPNHLSDVKMQQQ